MTSRSDYIRAQALAAARDWHELGRLAAEGKHRGDTAFTAAAAAVACIEGRPAEAIATLRSALDRAPTFTKQMAHWILAYAAARQGHSEAVADELDGYLSWHPRRGRLTLKRTSGFIEADFAFRAALSIQDVDSVWNDLGVLHFSFGYIEEAVSLFTECLARDPAHRYATINYAIALLAQGKAMQAQAFVARTKFRTKLPSDLVLNGVIQANAQGRAVAMPPRDFLDWRRRCAYSYDWLHRLPQLFECAEVAAEADR